MAWGYTSTSLQAGDAVAVLTENLEAAMVWMGRNCE